MPRWKALLLSLFLLTTATTASAQWDDVRNVYFDTIGTAFRATPIGIDEMKYVGSEYITRNDSVLMRYTTAIVQNDIDFHADFEFIPIDSFYMKTYEIKELDRLGWSRLGADLLVTLDAEFPAKKLRIRWRLFDTARNRQEAAGKVERSKDDWRYLGHEIANDIVRTLTGDDGIFHSKICFVRERSGIKELYIADYDGANERKLTETGSINLSPTFSPNGEEIFFTSYLDGDPHLYRVNTRSGKTSKAAGFPGIVAAPAVSPDGDKIACVLSKDGNSEIYVLDKKGQIIKRLTRHRAIDSSPTWSPDGQYIAFSSDRSGSPQVYIMDSDGLNLRRLTYQGRYNDSPIWSQHGDRITFVSRTKYGRFDLASIRVDGTDYRVMTEVGQNENPHFSPDGKHIIFSSNRLGPRDIFTMDVNGRNQHRLTRSGGNSNPVWGPLE
ncbi:MAG: Tol-Pal system beta propeller repeat protein TolB [candidate division Zixibacteria bacterium]|nr:Tol-Pal system beta propeller repeat protein TolB [candidate division Zixibacteria bacterium]